MESRYLTRQGAQSWQLIHAVTSGCDSDAVRSWLASTHPARAAGATETNLLANVVMDDAVLGATPMAVLGKQVSDKTAPKRTVHGGSRRNSDDLRPNAAVFRVIPRPNVLAGSRDNVWVTSCTYRRRFLDASSSDWFLPRPPRGLATDSVLPQSGLLVNYDHTASESRLGVRVPVDGLVT